MSVKARKAPYIKESLMKKVKNHLEKDLKTPIRTWSRASTIYPNFVGLTFEVYNGKKFISFAVSVDMIGHKLGEFSPTRTYHGHKKDKDKKKGR